MADFLLTSGVDNLTGTADADLFTGPAGGQDTLRGGGGNDIFDGEYPQAGVINGGAGIDTVRGGIGSGLWLLTLTNVEILELTEHQLVTSAVAQLAAFSTITMTGSADSPIHLNLENGQGGTLDLGARITGHAVKIIDNQLTTAVNLTGTALDDTLLGTQFQDTLNGGDGADSLNGGWGGGVINGGAGADWIYVGANDAALTVDAGTGDDTIRVDRGLGTIDGGDGLDTVIGSDIRGITFSNIEVLKTYVLHTGLQELAGFDSIVSQNEGGSSIYVRLSGAGGTFDFSTRMSADDTLILEDELFYSSEGEALTSAIDITGTAQMDLLGGSQFDDVLRGGAGNDELNGQAGNDTVYGGAGNDSIWLSYGDTDVAYGEGGNDFFYVTAGAGTVNGGAGTDRVANWSGSGLGDLVFEDVEIYDFSYIEGTIEQVTSFDTITNSNAPGSTISIRLGGPGGTLMLEGLLAAGHGAAVAAPGTSSAVRLTGTTRGDSLSGSDFNDTLRGGDGNDTLISGNGEDILIGGAGDDTYLLYSPQAARIKEDGGGRDTLAAVDFTVDLRTRPGFENLELIGSGDTDGTGTGVANLIVGGFGDNRLSGLGGNDTIYGGTGGEDTITGGDGDDLLLGESNQAFLSSSSNDTLNGGAGADTLYGGNGDDDLTGGAGADRMEGEDGNDTYHVLDGADLVIEAVGAGTDTVQSAVNFVLGANLENLLLTGAARTGTGNGLANRIAGNALDNTLLGLEGNDTLIGGAGDDELRGGAGADSMNGGLGNDRYLVDAAGDRVNESTAGASGGIDMVLTPLDYTLGANVENLRLQGAGNVNGTGNGLANEISGTTGANLLQGLGGNDMLKGNEGNDTLAGGAGDDTLSGGSHADVFRFTTSLAGADRIEDFNRNMDRFDLGGGSFSAATPTGADVVLQHNGGTIRIVNAPTLTLAQWNALVLPPGGGAAPLAAPASDWQGLDHLAAVARLHDGLVHLGHGDWVFA